MDMLENKKIRDKINELDTLPEAYHPNMASKWSLVEAGLEGRDDRKRFAWIRIRAAAVLILAGSVLFLIYDKSPDTTSQISKKSPVMKQEIKMTVLQPVQKIKEDLQPVKKHSAKKHKVVIPVKEEDKITVVPVDSIVQPIVLKTETDMLTTITPKRKKPRFVEVDFNDNVNINKPEETMARKINFKLGADRLSFYEVNGKMVIGLPIF